MKRVFVISLCILFCCCSQQNRKSRNDEMIWYNHAKKGKTAEESLLEIAKLALRMSIPNDLLDETSYKPISYDRFRPVYKTKSDVEYEIEQIKYLISFVDEIIIKNRSAGIGKDNFILPESKCSYDPYPYGLDRKLRDLGYFSLGDFIVYKSFYEHDQTYIYNRNYGNTFQSYHNVTWPPELGFFMHVKENELLPRYAELESNLKNFSENILVGYNLTHKYNASNIYGGAETHTIEVHFEKTCHTFWYIDDNNKMVIKYNSPLMEYSDDAEQIMKSYPWQ